MTGRRPHHRNRPQRAHQEAGLERIFGRHAVRAVLLARPRDARRLIVGGDGRDLGAILDLAAKAGVTPDLMPMPDFLHLGGFTSDEKHQGVLLLAEPRPVFSEKDFDRLEKARMVLALDQISDPQNLATMVRSAAFFGADAILLLRDRSADVSASVARYAAGGTEFVDVYRVTNLSQSLDGLKDYGFRVVGLDERGARTLAETTFSEKTVLVVGAEGAGLREKTKRYCDELVRIPGGREGVESLNAGVATAVAMAEIFRKG